MFTNTLKDLATARRLIHFVPIIDGVGEPVFEIDYVHFESVREADAASREIAERRYASADFPLVAY